MEERYGKADADAVDELEAQPGVGDLPLVGRGKRGRKTPVKEIEEDSDEEDGVRGGGYNTDDSSNGVSMEVSGGEDDDYDSYEDEEERKEEAKAEPVEKLSPLERRVRAIARTYACVEIIDNRVASIVPAAKQLRSQFRADSDFVWVYALDSYPEIPMPEELVNGLEGKGEEEVEAVRKRFKEDNRPMFVAVGQRTLERISPQYLFNPFKFSTFGTPLLIKLQLGKMTGRQLYDAIALRLRRFVINPEFTEGERGECDDGTHGERGRPLGTQEVRECERV